MSYAALLGARDVPSRVLQALIGQWAYNDPLNRARSVFNADPQAVQVDTITVNTGTNSHEYTFEIEGVEISYTADGSTSTTEVATGLAAAWNDSADAGAYGYASSSAAVVTITGWTPDLDYTIDQVDALCTLASVTVAAAADAVPHGRLMIFRSRDTTDPHSVLACLAKSSKLTAQVDTLTADYVSGEVYYVQIGVEGQTYGPVAVTANTDDGTTATDIATAINAMMPANTVIAAATSGGALTLTAEVAGKAFTVIYGTKSGTAARLTLAHTTSGVLTDINRAAVGVAMWSPSNESTTIGDSTPSWPANQGVMVATRGVLWVESAQSISDGDPVYVELGVTADNGKLFNTTSATRVLLTGAKWVMDERWGQGADIAAVRLSF